VCEAQPPSEFDADATRIEELSDRLAGSSPGRTLALPTAPSLAVSAIVFERYCYSLYDRPEMVTELIALGVSAFHPHEPCDGFDIFETKRRRGDRIAPAGNIDVLPVLGGGTAEQTRRETLSRLEGLSEGGGYICGSSHDIASTVKLGNLRVTAETIAAFRRGGTR
jgi:hypothetical protein